jgi:hypothetical protein
MWNNEPEQLDEPEIQGFRRLPASWFYFCLLAVVTGWVLSIAELVCLMILGRPR